MSSSRHSTSIKFLKAGLQTLIQDSGRIGLAHLGIPRSGYADRSAAKRANELLGNEPDAALIEICIVGPHIEFLGHTSFTITGAKFELWLDETKIENEQVYSVKKGSRLRFGKLLKGCRAYLAIAGDLMGDHIETSFSPLFYNSREVFAFPYVENNRIVEYWSSPGETPPLLSNEVNEENFSGTVRIIPGPDIDADEKRIVNWLLNSNFTLSPSSNRMALRLDTHQPFEGSLSQITSSGVFPGTIQLDHKGFPILLMPDAQTTGGYPRIAVVCEEDLDSCAQLRPGESIKFLLSG